MEATREYSMFKEKGKSTVHYFKIAKVSLKCNQIHIQAKIRFP